MMIGVEWNTMRPWSPYSHIVTIALVAFVSLSVFCDAQQTVTSPRSDGAQTPLRIFAPSGQACAPLAVISPGAGGTENGYSYLAEGLRDRGYLAVVMGHKESGPATLRKDIVHEGIHGGLKDMVTDPTLQHDRMLDLTATLAWAEKQCRHPYKVLLGHSMGSDTVVFEAGATNKLDVHGQDRFDAYVALSPSGPGLLFTKDSWSGIHQPLFVLTGTRDKGLEGTWEWRTAPYDGMPPGCKWLGVVDGATHMNFAGVGFAGKTKELTMGSVTAFLNGARSGKCALPATRAGITLKSK
jgi:predicted dienelactone hydrolase